MRARLAIACMALLAPRLAAADDAPATTSDPASPVEAKATQEVKRMGADLPDFDKIRTPDSPAFMLLEVSPTQIERPTTPKQLTAVLSKFVSEGDVVIPKNLAVEFSPHGLLSSAPSVQKYLARGWRREAVENITLSIATASTSRDVTDDMGVTTTHTDSDLAVGLRTNFKLSGQPKNGCSEADLTALIERSRAEAVTSTPEGAAVKAAGQEIAAAVARRASAQEIEALRVKMNDHTLVLKQKLVVNGDKLASLCIKEVGSVHRGWIMEVAGAVGWGFPDDAARRGRYQRASVWTDIAYEGDRLSLVFLARGRDDKTSGKHDYLSELGTRGILAKDAYAVSLETVWRWAFDRSDVSTADEHTFRVAVALDIHIRDSTWLTLAFGSDFSADDPGSLFSLANIKYGVGDPKVTLARPAVATPP